MSLGLSLASLTSPDSRPLSLLEFFSQLFLETVDASLGEGDAVGAQFRSFCSLSRTHLSSSVTEKASTTMTGLGLGAGGGGSLAPESGAGKFPWHALEVVQLLGCADVSLIFAWSICEIIKFKSRVR